MVGVPARVAFALAMSALMSIGLLAFSDVLLTIPVGSLVASGPDAAALFAVSTRGHIQLLAPFLAFQLFIVVALPLTTSKPRWSFLLTTSVAIACSLKSYALLIEYPRFAGYPPFMVAWLALAGFLAVGYANVCSARLRSRIAIVAIALLGAATAEYANANFFSGAYPTLHRALSSVAYLLLQVGLLSLLGSTSSRSFSRRGEWAAAALGTAFLVATLFVASFASVRAVRHYRTFTTIGRSEIVGGSPWRGACTNQPQPMTESAALEAFARFSGMPALPESFRLGHYNVLLITIEALRFDDTSLSGSNDLTPNLHRIAKDSSFVFDDFMAASNHTFQSIIGLLKGTYPSHARTVIGAPMWTGQLRDGARTAIEIFRESGYSTFAALHALMPGVTNSFDHRFHELRHAHQVGDPEADRETADWTIEQLTTRAASGERFFGWVFLIAPHSPYYDRDPPTSRDRDRYRQNVTYADAQLGRIYDHLHRSGLSERTVLVIVGDHGEEFLDHFGVYHARTLYNEMLHVPAIVRLPGVSGSRVSHAVSATYVMPWLMRSEPRVMGAAARATIQHHLAPMLTATHGAVISEVNGWDRMKAALIWNDRKLVYDLFSGFTEIFERSNDPQERRNLAEEPTQLRIELLARLDAYLALRACNQRIEISDEALRLER